MSQLLHFQRCRTSPLPARSRLIHGKILNMMYSKTAIIMRTESKNLNVSRLIFLLSFPKQLKPRVKSRMNEDVVGAALTGDAQTASE